MTRYLLTRTRKILSVETIEIEAPNEEHARLKAAEYFLSDPDKIVLEESLEAEAMADLDTETDQ